MEFVKPTLPIEDEHLISLPTWETSIVIPIVQNLLGGAAVGGLGLIGFIATQSWRNVVWYVDDASLWCILAGSLVTCLITIIRFFGDDLGIVIAAYHAGVASQQSRIAALELELRASYDAQSAAEANGNITSTINDRKTLMIQTRKDAAKLIEVAFAGDSTSRAAMKGRGMGQRDWERAVRLLMASGAMNGDGIIVATNPAQALHAIDKQLSSDAQQGNNFSMKWQ